MAVGLDADTDYLTRTGVPSGGAGTLSDGGFNNFAFMGLFYRPSSGPTNATMSLGALVHMKSSARELLLGFDNNFGAGTAADPNFRMLGDGFNDLFATQPPFDAWIEWYIKDNADTLEAGWRELGDTVWDTVSRSNPNAGSQYINTIYIGSNDGTNVAYGHHAYVRAVYGGLTQGQIEALLASDQPDAGDWAFWELPDNTDLTDSSGNGRDLTAGGTLTSESSPNLSPPAALVCFPSQFDRCLTPEGWF